MSTLHVENLKGLSSGSNANKIIVPSGQTLHAPGHVIQHATTLSAVNNGNYTSTSLTHITTFDTSFTPKFANSIIRLSWNGMVDVQTSSAPNPWFSFSFFQDSTDLQSSGLTYNGTGYNQFIGSNGGTKYINMVDEFSAGSTSARTYKIYVRVGASTHVAYLSTPTRRRMIVEEIAQ